MRQRWNCYSSEAANAWLHSVNTLKRHNLCKVPSMSYEEEKTTPIHTCTSLAYHPDPQCFISLCFSRSDIKCHLYDLGIWEASAYDYVTWFRNYTRVFLMLIIIFSFRTHQFCFDSLKYIIGLGVLLSCVQYFHQCFSKIGWHLKNNLFLFSIVS